MFFFFSRQAAKIYEQTRLSFDIDHLSLVLRPLPSVIRPLSSVAPCLCRLYDFARAQRFQNVESGSCCFAEGIKGNGRNPGPDRLPECSEFMDETFVLAGFLDAFLFPTLVDGQFPKVIHLHCNIIGEELEILLRHVPVSVCEVV